MYMRVDDRGVAWDAANRKHLGQDHPERSISIDEIDQALADSGRIETYSAERSA